MSSPGWPKWPFRGSPKTQNVGLAECVSIDQPTYLNLAPHKFRYVHIEIVWRAPSGSNSHPVAPQALLEWSFESEFCPRRGGIHVRPIGSDLGPGRPWTEPQTPHLRCLRVMKSLIIYFLHKYMIGWFHDTPIIFCENGDRFKEILKKDTCLLQFLT